MTLTLKSAAKCRGTALLCAILPTVALAQSNPLARAPEANVAGLNGRWNGAHIEQRSNCRTATNDGFHGTYAEYIYDVDRAGASITLTENAVNGLHCTYFGPLAQGVWSGELSCSDGRTGTYSSRAFVVTANEVSVRLAIRLTGSETCEIDAILGGSRF
jgi:hypothetical protein